MNKHGKEVKQIENIINSNRDEPVELEISVQIDNDNGNQKIYPGIQFYIPGYDCPIFIAVGELRILADAADKYCSTILENKKKNTVGTKSPKKTH